MPEDDNTDAPEDVPSEDDTVLGGEHEDEFNFEAFSARLSAGKYDGNLLVMAAALHTRGISLNVRRWRCTFRDESYLEEDVSAEVADYAEQWWNVPGQGWGYITALLGDNVRSNIRPARAVLYGICRSELRMTERDARRALKLTAAEVMACFDWDEVEPPGFTEDPA